MIMTRYRSELLSMEENKDAPFLDADTVRYFEGEFRCYT